MIIFFISMLYDRHKEGFFFSHNALPFFFQKESSLRPSGSPLESWGGDLVRKNIDGVVHDVEGGVLHVVVIHITAWWMCQKAVSRSRLDLKIIKLSINYIKRGCRGREIDPDCFSYLGNNARLIMQQRSRNDNQGISFSREIQQKNKDFLELFALILAEAAYCPTFTHVSWAHQEWHLTLSPFLRISTTLWHPKVILCDIFPPKNVYFHQVLLKSSLRRPN